MQEILNSIGISMQIIMWLAWVVVPITVTLALVIWATHRLVIMWFKGKKKRLIKKIRRGIARTGARFYYNWNSGVFAVCSEKALQEGVTEHMKKVEAHEIGLWEKVVCYATPTFTFSERHDNWKPGHTGFFSDLELILSNLVHEATGMSLETLNRKEREEALKLFLIRDERLFVPFSGSGKPTSFELSRYEKIPLSEVSSHIRLP